MLADFMEYGYAGLFVLAFLAATILPIGSEVFFMAMIAAGFDPWWCLVWASLGNTLGGMTNYWLGWLGKTEWVEKYLKVSKAKIRKMQKWLHYKGALTAFFSFLPAVGDLIPLALGYMKADVYVTAGAMLAGKLARYALLIYGTIWGLNWLNS